MHILAQEYQSRVSIFGVVEWVGGYWAVRSARLSVCLLFSLARENKMHRFSPEASRDVATPWTR